jgi:GTPase
MSFTVAIVGRPNVGKSTLFNRLTGKRHALVDDMPGVTRDRRNGDAHIAGLEFQVIDTAGLEEAEEESLAARMTLQTEQAIDEADVTMMVIDGRSGITPIDEHFARLVRKKQKPMILIVNKAEGGKATATITDAYRLGFGEPVAISAEHGEGLAELYAALAPFAKEAQDVPDDVGDGIMQIAIVGRPNAGKSTLLNRILGEERVLTGPEAGITRDAITVPFTFEGKLLKLVDTAGMRKKSNVTGKLEKLAVSDALRSIQYAHVVVLVLDAQMPLEKQDNTIASLIEQEGRAMVIAVNKWDTVDDKHAYINAIYQRLEKVLPQVKGIPVVPISATTGHNIAKLLKECFHVYDLWNTQISTGQLNRYLEAALEAHTPPMVSGRRIKIRYITQKSARPPSFILFTNMNEIPDHYMRYLINGMRERFKLPAVPIRIRVRKNKNPYADAPTD